LRALVNGHVFLSQIKLPGLPLAAEPVLGTGGERPGSRCNTVFPCHKRAFGLRLDYGAIEVLAGRSCNEDGGILSGLRAALSLLPAACRCSGVNIRVGRSYLRFSRACASFQCSMDSASSCACHGFHSSGLRSGCRASRAAIKPLNRLSSSAISFFVMLTVSRPGVPLRRLQVCPQRVRRPEIAGAIFRKCLNPSFGFVPACRGISRWPELRPSRLAKGR